MPHPNHALPQQVSLDLLKLAARHQLYDVIVTPNPNIDAGYVNLTAMRLHFPPPSPPHLCLASSVSASPSLGMSSLKLPSSALASPSCKVSSPGVVQLVSKVRARHLLSPYIRCVYARNLVDR